MAITPEVAEFLSTIRTELEKHADSIEARGCRLEIFKEGDPKWYEDSVDFIVHKQGSAATSSDYRLARTPDGGVIIEQATPPGISMGGSREVRSAPDVVVQRVIALAFQECAQGHAIALDHGLGSFPEGLEQQAIKQPLRD